MKVNPRCSCTTADGSQCGRRVRDGSQPPVCSVHKAVAQGQHVGGAPPFQGKPLDPIAKLKKIARNDKHPRQMEALRMLLDLGAKADDRPDYGAAFVKALSEDEKKEGLALLEAWETFRAAMYAKYPELPRPASELETLAVQQRQSDSTVQSLNVTRDAEPTPDDAREPEDEEDDLPPLDPHYEYVEEDDAHDEA